MSTPRIWMDGHLVDASAAHTSLLAPALHYGLGVFEGIRSYATPRGPAIFRLEAHMARMARGAEALGMPFNAETCAQACIDTLADSGFGDAYLRPLAFYGQGTLGLDVDRHTTRLMVAALPWQNHLGEAAARGVRAHRSAMQRNTAQAIPPLKLCGGYVNSVLAKRQATLAGFDEALFVDERGFAVEATGENVFLVKDGRVTAVEHPDALPGITRATVMELTGAESRPVTLQELLEADEVFLTGTSAEITPLIALDAHTWRAGAITLDLRRRYLTTVRGAVDLSESWLTRLEPVTA
ncbi:MAG: branched-chain-amino-acid transaminase [Holophaga sp.]|nr:branched-chain-amino-acid transaminase [Holophaga sp.]